MKKLLVLAAFALISSVAFSQTSAPEQKASTPEQKSDLWQLDVQPLYILDDKIIKQEDLKSLKPDGIASISVLKDKQATTRYGENGKNGVIIITTKEKEIKDRASSTN